MKIAIIGAGNMGGAIACGLAENFVEELVIAVSNPSRHKLKAIVAKYPNIQVSTDNKEVISDADYIILAVKPWILPGVITEIAPEIDADKQAIVSVAGGVGLDDLDKMLSVCNGQPEVYHVIPDTAIAVGKSMTFISSKRARQHNLEFLQRIFSAIGEVAIIEERLMPAATALSSCGIAYVFKYVQACIQAGVQMGFYPSAARNYVVATIEGAMQLLRDNNTMPQQEIDKVTTPGGLTIKGINMLDHCGFTSAVIKANLAPLEEK